MLKIRAATIEDTAAICKLAEAIWWPTYTPILTPEQITYMLEMMYTPSKIKGQIATGEQQYLVLGVDGILTGFAAFAPENRKPGSI